MPMLQRIVGSDGVTQLSVESKHSAARVVTRPMDVGTGGSYSIGLVSGVIDAGLAGNSEVFQARWTSAAKLCIPRLIRVSASVSTTAFIAGVPPQLELRPATVWSAQGTGGAGVTFAADDSKKKITFATSAFAAGDMRMATTTGLGAGTKTLGGQALATILGNGGVATSSTTLFPAGTVLWEKGQSDGFPLVLAQNEGFVIRSVEVPGTGTWKLAVQFEWDEVTPSEITGWA